MADQQGNIDQKTVEGFGDEWSAYDQIALGEEEHRRLFNRYFQGFPLDDLSASAEGFDLGCGSGRWAALVAPRVGLLHCIDPSEAALATARNRLGNIANIRFHLAAADTITLTDESQDFGYSLGVLHHVPDTERALADCVRKLKVGAPFLLYLYYRFDNRPAWYRALWRASDVVRRGVAKLPFRGRKSVCGLIAALVYWPSARLALAAERAGVDVTNFPLASYRHDSFYTMRTDALDRFGTRLEHRFTRSEIEAMMRRAGLVDIRFRNSVPFWTAWGRRG